MPEYQQIHQSKKPDTVFQKQATSVSQTHVSNPAAIIQRAKINPKSLTHADVIQLQRTIGNQAVSRLLSGIGSFSTAQHATVQRQEIPEEETCSSCMQKQEIPEEEEPLQGKFERVTGSNEPVLRKNVPTTTVNGVQVNDDPSLEHEADVMGAKAAQFVPAPEEEPLQVKLGEEVAQKTEKAVNNTGLPDNLKAGIENLSGLSMDGVKVHYNSGTPAQLNALAYAQGSGIHVAPGQEKYLPHEAWHVVQQKQGRVQPTIQMMGGGAINIENGIQMTEGGATNIENGVVSIKRGLRFISMGVKSANFDHDHSMALEMEKSM